MERFSYIHGGVNGWFFNKNIKIPGAKPRQLVRMDGSNVEINYCRATVENQLALNDLGGRMSYKSVLEDITDASKFNPMPHQEETIEFLLNNPRGFDLSEMGTGKTASAIWAAEVLLRLGLVHYVIVLCPVSCMASVWMDEIFKLVPGRKATMLTSPIRRSLVNNDKLNALSHLKQENSFLIMNHDGVRSYDFFSALMQGGVLVIVDESAEFRESNTRKFKSLYKVVNNDTLRDVRLWQLTGAPTPASPMDAFAQAKLNNPKWQQTKTRWKYKTMAQVSSFKWVPKKSSAELSRQVLSPAIRHERDKCLSLPDQVIVKRDVALSKAQAKAFKTMRDGYTMAHDGGTITAQNAAIKIAKLLQIVGGIAYDNNGKPVDLPHKPRIDEVKSIINQVSGKVIVFSPFTHSAKMIHSQLDDAALVIGDTPASERRDIFRQFQSNSKHNVIVANPKTMAHGVTLTEANCIIWYLPPFSLNIYDQANARINRTGQTKKNFVVHLIATPIERQIYKTLTERGQMQAALLDLYRGY